MAFYNKLLQFSIFSILEQHQATRAPWEEAHRCGQYAGWSAGGTSSLNSSRKGEIQRSVTLTQALACRYSSLSVANLTPEAGFHAAPNLLIASYLLTVHHPTFPCVTAWAGSEE